MIRSIETNQAPAAIGTYSQGIVYQGVLYISGQLPLIPETMEFAGNDGIGDDGIDEQIRQVFRNLAAIAAAAGTSLDSAIKLTVYLTNLGHFPRVNAVMEELLSRPFPARAVVEASALPRGAQIEIDALVAVPRQSE